MKIDPVMYALQCYKQNNGKNNSKW